MQRHFQQVDVFPAGVLAGNPLAVVLDCAELSTGQMQRLASWMNLSETVFLLPPTDPLADYRVRIFTLACELPFAGHPTLGACHAWLMAGGKARDPNRIVQQCGAGLVPIRRSAGRLAFAAPPLVRAGPVEERLIDDLAAVLRISRSDIVAAQWVDNGPGWVAVLLDSAEAVLALEPAPTHAGQLDLGAVGPYPEGAECAFELRAFFADEQGRLREDPVTGSLNASVAQWLLATRRARAPYIAAQGTRLGCRGRIRIEQDADGTVWVGGDTVTRITGQLSL